MDVKKIVNGLRPHAFAMGVFLVMLVIYFKPAFFDKKTLLQNDVMQGLAASHESVEYREKTGKEALWSNSMFSGMPLYVTNVVYSGDLIKYAMAGFIKLPRPADNVMISLFCCYIFLIVIGCRSWIALVGAFSYAFSSFHIISIEAGHIYKSWAMAFMPLMFSGVYLIYKGRYILGVALASLAFALELNSQHYQITYYLGLTVIIYSVSEFIFAIKEKRLVGFFKSVAVLVFAVALGLGTNVGRLWGLEEYGKYSIRGKSDLTAKTEGAEGSNGLDRDYAFSWSQGVMETFTLLIPDFYGGSSNTNIGKNSATFELLKTNGVPAADAKNFVKNAPTYWGDQPFTSGPVYAGAIIVFLFVLGLFIVEPRHKYWLLFATIFSIMLCWGKNFPEFNNLMFDYFPGYNKFRSVSMAVTIALFCMPVLASLALEKIATGKLLDDYKLPLINRKVNPIIFSAGLLVGILTLVLLFSGSAEYSSEEVDKQLPAWILDAIKSDRKSMLQNDAFRSMLLILFSGTLLYLFNIKRLNQLWLIGGISVLMVFDLWMVDKRYLNDDSFVKGKRETYFQPTEIDNMILQDKSLDYRVMDIHNPFNNAMPSYFHKSIGGYHGVKMKRYQELIEYHISKNNMRVLDMLNTKYFVTTDQQRPLQQNPGALGNAWFVSTIKKVKNPDEEIKALDDFTPANEAIIDDSRFKISNYKFYKDGEIKLVEYQPNYLKYEMDKPDAGFAVFSEIYYKEGWDAYIDGKKAPYVRVNYVLRAMEVPAGKHVIEFKFDPASYTIGNKIMMTSSILVYIFFLGGLGLAIRGKLKE